MPQVVSVRFRFSPKPLWFDPLGKDYQAGAEVLVETERGREVGTLVNPSIEATDKDISRLKSSLKPVIRELNDLDLEHVEALNEKGRSAMPYFRAKVEEYVLDIKPVEVQYLFSGERAIFYFSSEERVDFRDLVRDLAQYFHVRIDMRQIGARDEAKELGGLAHCGEEFCCTRFGGEFQPVSIRMAKEQDLPLNPTKISGACGRLMCCLRYEYEAYKDFKKRAPKKGTPVDTPLGEAVISGYNTPSETMELRLQDGKRLSVPLAEMDCTTGGEGCKRCSVNHETIERCASQSVLMALGSLGQTLDDSQSTLREESLLDNTSSAGGGERKRRRRSAKSGETAQKNASSGAKMNTQASQRSSSQQSEDEKPSGGNRKRRRRTSSGGTSGEAGSAQQKTAQHAALSGQSTQSAQAAQSGKSAQQQSQRTQPRHQKGAPASGAEQNNTPSSEKPRPGQRSSGLRKRRSGAGANSENHTQSPETTRGQSAQAQQAARGQASQSQESRTQSGRNQLDGAGASASDGGTGTRKKRRRHESTGSRAESASTTSGNASSNGSSSGSTSGSSAGNTAGGGTSSSGGNASSSQGNANAGSPSQ